MYNEYMYITEMLVSDLLPCNKKLGIHDKPTKDSRVKQHLLYPVNITDKIISGNQ
jgi:hypothetical protein